MGSKSIPNTLFKAILASCALLLVGGVFAIIEIKKPIGINAGVAEPVPWYIIYAPEYNCTLYESQIKNATILYTYEYYCLTELNWSVYLCTHPSTGEPLREVGYTKIVGNNLYCYYYNGTYFKTIYNSSYLNILKKYNTEKYEFYPAIFTISSEPDVIYFYVHDKIGYRPDGFFYRYNISSDIVEKTISTSISEQHTIYLDRITAILDFSTTRGFSIIKGEYPGEVFSAYNNKNLIVMTPSSIYKTTINLPGAEECIALYNDTVDDVPDAYFVDFMIHGFIIPAGKNFVYFLTECDISYKDKSGINLLKKADRLLLYRMDLSVENNSINVSFTKLLDKTFIDKFKYSTYFPPQSPIVLENTTIIPLIMDVDTMGFIVYYYIVASYDSASLYDNTQVYKYEDNEKSFYFVTRVTLGGDIYAYPFICDTLQPKTIIGPGITPGVYNNACIDLNFYSVYDKDIGVWGVDIFNLLPQDTILFVPGAGGIFPITKLSIYTNKTITPYAHCFLRSFAYDYNKDGKLDPAIIIECDKEPIILGSVNVYSEYILYPAVYRALASVERIDNYKWVIKLPKDAVLGRLSVLCLGDKVYISGQIETDYHYISTRPHQILIWWKPGKYFDFVEHIGGDLVYHLNVIGRRLQVDNYFKINITWDNVRIGFDYISSDPIKKRATTPELLRFVCYKSDVKLPLEAFGIISNENKTEWYICPSIFLDGGIVDLRQGEEHRVLFPGSILYMAHKLGIPLPSSIQFNDTPFCMGSFCYDGEILISFTTKNIYLIKKVILRQIMPFGAIFDPGIPFVTEIYNNRIGIGAISSKIIYGSGLGLQRQTIDDIIWYKVIFTRPSFVEIKEEYERIPTVRVNIIGDPKNPINEVSLFRDVYYILKQVTADFSRFVLILLKKEEPVKPVTQQQRTFDWWWLLILLLLLLLLFLIYKRKERGRK